MNSPARAALLLFTALAAAACSDSVTSPANRLLTTDSTSYTAIPVGYDQVIIKVVTRFRNPTSSPIILPRCFPTTPYPLYTIELVAPADGESAAYNADQACVEHNDQIVVAPGETRVDTITLHGPTAYDSKLGKYLGTLAGTFRIAYGGQESNEFAIVMPPEGVVPDVPRDGSAAIQTESLLVHMIHSGPLLTATSPIHVTIYNPRADTSFIANCNGSTGLSLEKQVGTQWVTAWNAASGACFSPTIVIPPRTNYQMAIDLYGVPAGANGLPRFNISDIPGVYRFVWLEIESSNPTVLQPVNSLIPVEQRRSNAFAIVVEP